ncbi:hypothetical protein [Sphaerotilus sp.]|uniref:hypothetical protein n=1 Tax=Sphaerotilus sp. TaxID=2093942 RepID=UPI00286DE47F|nr:hypothetical protein [Sphaerotilus sp.]
MAAVVPVRGVDGAWVVRAGVRVDVQLDLLRVEGVEQRGNRRLQRGSGPVAPAGEDAEPPAALAAVVTGGCFGFLACNAGAVALLAGERGQPALQQRVVQQGDQLARIERDCQWLMGCRGRLCHAGKQPVDVGGEGVPVQIGCTAERGGQRRICRLRLRGERRPVAPPGFGVFLQSGLCWYRGWGFAKLHRRTLAPPVCIDTGGRRCTVAGSGRSRGKAEGVHDVAVVPRAAARWTASLGSGFPAHRGKSCGVAAEFGVPLAP